MMLLECLSIGIVVWVFHSILFQPGMVFGWWGDWVYELSKTRPQLAKPLGFCGVCFGGQVGFWWYLVAYRDNWILGHHIIFTCQVIAAYWLLSKIEAWLSK